MPDRRQPDPAPSDPAPSDPAPFDPAPRARGHSDRNPSDRTEERRAALRATLTDIAERWIADGGIARIKARPLAAEARCAVGAIYMVFPDLTALIMAVNARTFDRLGRFVTDATPPGSPPQDALVAMSVAYLRFAAANTHAWRSLFDLEMSTETDVPQWYLDALAQLFGLIAAPLRVQFPTETPAGIDLLTRTLFSSVHGIVLLGLERRISGVPMDQMEAMIGLLIRNVTSQHIVS